MRVLIVGASGLVGWNCLAHGIAAGHEVLGTYHRFVVPNLTQLSLNSESAVRSLISEFEPEAVICCSGWTWVDGCQLDSPKAMQRNCAEPRGLAEIAHQVGAQFVHLSTSYVFDGFSGPYSEDDSPSPICVYGQSKLAGEQAVLEVTGGRAIIARTMGVYGLEPQRKNFVYQVIDNLSKGRRMRVPSDQAGNATYAPDIAEGLFRLIYSKAHGIWNIAGPDPHLRREVFALQIASEYNLDPSFFDFVPTCDFHGAAPRPLQGGLVIARAATQFAFAPSVWIRL